jgi:hypothetical protein
MPELTPTMIDAADTTVEAVKKAMIKDIRTIAKLPPSAKAKLWFYVAAKVPLKNPKAKPVNLFIVMKDPAQKKLWDERLKTHTPRATSGLCKVELVKDVPAVTIGALKGSGDRKAVLLTTRTAFKEAGSKVNVADEREQSKADTKAAAEGTPGGKAAIAQAATAAGKVLSNFGLNPKAASALGKELGVATEVVNMVITQNEARLNAAVAKAVQDAKSKAGSS